MNAKYVQAVRKNYTAARAAGFTDARWLSQSWPPTRDWVGGEVGVRVTATICGIDLTNDLLAESCQIWFDSCTLPE